MNNMKDQIKTEQENQFMAISQTQLIKNMIYKQFRASSHSEEQEFLVAKWE